MKLDELKKLIKASVREVVREELEYHFNKLYESVGRVKTDPISEQREGRRPTSASTNSRTGQISALTDKYRNSFNDMMEEDLGEDLRPAKKITLKEDNILTRTIFHDTSPLEESGDDHIDSILDESKVRSLKGSNKHKSVYDALTRDYSQLVKAMNQS